jgi:hypothetical protein
MADFAADKPVGGSEGMAANVGCQLLNRRNKKDKAIAILVSNNAFIGR